MSTSSSSNSYSTPTLIPSPEELSRLITNPYTNEQVDRKFRNKPTSSAILRYYTFISHSITELEGELERHPPAHKARNTVSYDPNCDWILSLRGINPPSFEVTDSLTAASWVCEFPSHRVIKPLTRGVFEEGSEPCSHEGESQV